MKKYLILTLVTYFLEKIINPNSKNDFVHAIVSLISIANIFFFAYFCYYLYYDLKETLRNKNTKK